MLPVLIVTTLNPRGRTSFRGPRRSFASHGRGAHVRPPLVPSSTALPVCTLDFLVEPAANKDAAFKRAMLVHAQSASSTLTTSAPFALAVTTCVLHRWPRTLLLLEGAKETLCSALTNDLSSHMKASLCAGLVLSPSFRDSTISPPRTTDA
ncbi:hypothetical protein K438DRAFT_1982070 [Mycena galopus ATCC 62051]|nr:hypothetical protein K438DRAFT_1982070 [Mycena galopus ATCC 62051]